MRRALLPIFLIVLVDILGMTIILPLLPFYAEEFGASLAHAHHPAAHRPAGPLPRARDQYHADDATA